MTILDAIVLGLVEGITEYLPVSSTGHLILATWLLGLREDKARLASIDAFNIIIQGGAILAVLLLYRARVAQMLRGILGLDRAGLQLFGKICIAFLPAAVFGKLFDDAIEAKLFHPVPVLMMLGGGGILLLLIGKWMRSLVSREEGESEDFVQLSYRAALCIGLFQCVAMVPGTSRSLMAILGGLLCGLSPRRSAEFSFLLGLPTLGAACLYKLMQASNDAGGFTPFADSIGGPVPMLVGIAVATVSAALAVRWLVSLLSRGGLEIFGIWRIAVAVILGALLVSGNAQLS
ncbi:MAG: undecaprenyl-diphosphate phosphatase [Phycisphaerales bacterium]|nr:undecaprenyl-diphosphate phosphatase [Phycisphaerales bacterium]